MNYFFFIICLISMPLLSQQSTPKEAFLEKWENSSDYLMQIIDLIPEESLDYAPTQRQMSFEKQLLHIQRNIEWLGTVYFTEATQFIPTDENEKGIIPFNTKKILKQRLKTAFDTLAERVRKTPVEDLSETVDFFAGPKSKWQILNLLQDHVTHHRGQLIVYLNLEGIEPPKYVGW